MERYILYVRKSTDTEDKQVLSIEAQLAELRKFAKDQNLFIIDEMIEKRTAKMPGRPVFNEMLGRIQNGEANGILAWHPDRLARNSIDGGQIIYLLDQTVLNFLRFPIFQFENTSQGKFMLNIMFGQSKYYVDNLSENTKRGLRAKVRNGDFPSVAPFGYLNDTRNKTIILDKRYAPLALEMFERYAKGNQTMEKIAIFLKENGAITRGGKLFSDDQVKAILQNPFYYGHFIYGGEIHEGRHKPIVSKSLWDKVQVVIERRGHRQPTKGTPIAFTGLLRCGHCGMRITAETKRKTQKNGNSHTWTYYRCTRKHKMIKCVEPAVRENILIPQLSALLGDYEMPTEVFAYMNDKIAESETAENAENLSVSEKLRGQIAHLIAKQKILLDSYLDQDIDRQTFLAKKSDILGEKKSLEDSLANITRNQNCWIEPMRNWLEIAKSICCLRESNDFDGQKAVLLEIFGSNLFLIGKSATPNPNQNNLSPELKTALCPLSESHFCLWQKLKETKEKLAGNPPKSQKIAFLVISPGIEPGLPG